MNDKQKKESINFLKKDEIYNLSIIGFITESEIEEITNVKDSFLVKGRDGDKWIYFSAKNENDFIELTKNLTNHDKCFGALDDWMIPILIKDKKVDWLINAYQFHFPDNKEIPENKIKTRKLKKEDSEYIISQSNYKEILSVEYLNERIEKSASAGICDDGKLVAWALTHDDGSLGTMHVLEGHRRKGFAKEITFALIRQCREISKIPFLQCETKNTPAQKLVEGLGFVKDRNVSWLKLK